MGVFDSQHVHRIRRLVGPVKTRRPADLYHGLGRFVAADSAQFPEHLLWFHGGDLCCHIKATTLLPCFLLGLCCARRTFHQPPRVRAAPANLDGKSRDRTTCLVRTPLQQPSERKGEWRARERDMEQVQALQVLRRLAPEVRLESVDTVRAWATEDEDSSEDSGLRVQHN